jgi:hypothetical protein
LVLREEYCRPPVFLSERLFLFYVGETYITLTWVAIVTDLSFRNLYGDVANVLCPCRKCRFFDKQPCNYDGIVWRLKHRLKQSMQSPSTLPRIKPLSPLRGCQVLFSARGLATLMSDKATTVHKVPVDEKKT